MDDFDREKQRLVEEYEKASKEAHGVFVVKEMPLNLNEIPKTDNGMTSSNEHVLSIALSGLCDEDGSLVKAEIVAMSTAAMQAFLSNPDYSSMSPRQLSSRSVYQAIRLMIELRQTGVM